MEELSIINAVTNIFNGADKHDWELVRNSFHHEVFLDYFSMSGQPGEKIKSSEIINRWSAFLPKFKFTFHTITNFEISVERTNASAFCKGQALHCLPGSEAGDTWTTYGTYDFKLLKSGDQWKVTSMTFNFLYETGNKELPKVAANSNS